MPDICQRERTTHARKKFEKFSENCSKVSWTARTLPRDFFCVDRWTQTDRQHPLTLDSSQARHRPTEVTTRFILQGRRRIKRGGNDNEFFFKFLLYKKSNRSSQSSYLSSHDKIPPQPKNEILFGPWIVDYLRPLLSLPVYVLYFCISSNNSVRNVQSQL